MASKNRVTLGGNLTKDPEMKRTTGGTTVAEFGLAVTRPAPAGQEPGTDYFTVVAFGKLGDVIAERKQKGDAVVIEGEISYSSWEHKETGQRRSRTTIKADDVQFVDGVGNGINHVVLIGNLTRNPELGTVDTASEGGVSLCNFGLAINRVRSKDKDAVDFVDVDVWREPGEAVAEYKTKGEGVMVEGRLRYESWQANDGSPRSRVKVLGDSVQFTTAKTPAKASAKVPPKAGATGSSNGSADGTVDGTADRAAHASAPATKAQISRLEREATAVAGEDGPAKLAGRLGKELSELTKAEASVHIDKFVKAAAERAAV